MNSKQLAQDGHQLYAVGDVLDGRYRLEGVLGQGGQGVVWHATDLLSLKSAEIDTASNSSWTTTSGAATVPSPMSCQVALKFFRSSDTEGKRMGKLESILLCSIEHPNVLAGSNFGKADLTQGQSADFADSKAESVDDVACGPFTVEKVKIRNARFVAMELAQQFDLGHYIQYTGKFFELHALELFLQLTRGIQAIHQAGYAIRDIKLDNILISQDFKLKIADLGLAAPLKGCTCFQESHDMKNESCQQNSGGKLHTVAGSFGFVAPEIYQHIHESSVPEGYDGDKADIFSAGVLLFTLLFGVMPFHNADSSDYFYHHLITNEPHQFWCKQGERRDCNAFPLGQQRVVLDRTQPQTIYLIETMLSFNPQNRPTIEEIMQTTEMLIESKLAALTDPLEGIAAESELYNRYQYMLEQQRKGCS